MTTAEQMMMLADMFDEDERPSEERMLAYLEQARWKVLNRMYPFGVRDGAEVPERYQALQVEIAAYLINKRGAEGQTSHSENGVSRVYGGSDVPESMMKPITPRGKVL